MEEDSFEHLLISNPEVSTRAQSAAANVIESAPPLKSPTSLFPSPRGIELEYPSRLVAPSNWLGHIPFAFWLVDALGPQTIVELGVHTGNSYFAFLQAVQTLGMSTRCFGIDHWRGDEHSGFYGDEIYNELKAAHDQSYETFSTLLRCSFAEALPSFKERSIDLLHIDGFHTYEAVASDFMSWLPKMSPRGVVLFHDTNVKERGFGIWQFWEKLTERYPTFEFHHSFGLGVAFVGNETLPPSMHCLTAATTDTEINTIRTYFSRLGAAIVDRYAIGELERDIVALRTERDTAVAHAVAEVVARDQRLVDLNETLRQATAQADADARRLMEEVVRRDQQLVSADSGLHGLTAEVALRDQRLLELNEQLRQASANADSDARRLMEEAARRNQQFVTVDSELHRLTAEIALRDQRLVDLNEQLRQVSAQADADVRRLTKEAIQRDQQLVIADSELHRMIEEIAKRDQRLVELIEVANSTSERDDANKHILILEAEIVEALERIAVMESQGQTQTRILRQQTLSVARLQNEASTLNEQQEAARQLLKQTERDAMAVRVQRDVVREQLQQVLQSKSWRVTALIRSTTSALRQLKRTMLR